MKNLVIVESPAKARTIGNFLGKEFTVKSSFGHVRDLSKKNISVDVEDNFKPFYEISPDKTKIVKELKTLSKDADVIWLATDEDREGEAISWHLVEALNLDEEKIKRIVFHEITKNAISEAINNPRGINKKLVDAQQARRVLDRLVGFELSPILWRKVKPALSAGRVQSVAVRLIVEKEEEIKSFEVSEFYRVTASFEILNGSNGATLNAELPQKFSSKKEAVDFLKKCLGATFKIVNIETKPVKKSPPPPFTTSTLQQEASRKLGFSVANTMRVAQQLYESGKITYMRTDSVNLSNLAISMAQKVISESYGDEYVKTRKYTTKAKGAQEAHEAIRPTYLENQSVDGDNSQKKLYDLIWKRTIASQMSNAQLEKTNVKIGISNLKEQLVARGEVIKFDGFLKVYMESVDDENGEAKNGVLPPVSIGQELLLKEMNATQRFTQPPYRYSEATLVKKLEELGIGRPSTYAPIISTIQKREYVTKEDKPSKTRNYQVITLKGTDISESESSENYGYVKGRLFPTDIGILVNNFLMKNFQEIMDYNFTASVEKEFDEIAQGKKEWDNMIKEFYGSFHDRVEEAMQSAEKAKGEKLLGVDPRTKRNIYVKLGKYGPIAQMGETGDDNKPKFAALKKGQSLESITLDEALELFKLPRELGQFENELVTIGTGRYGPYVRHKNSFYSLQKTDDPLSVELDRAIEIIEAKRKEEKERIIREFPENKDVTVLRGRYGPYISIGKDNYKIPKGRNPEELTLKDCLEIAETTKSTKAKRRTKKK